MPIAYIYWLFIILWLVFGFWWHWPAEQTPRGFGVLGGNLLLFILLLLLGIGVFGWPIKG